MTPRTDTVPPPLMRKLELAGDRAFDLVVRDLLKRTVRGDKFDYPVAAVAMDETGSLILGQGVSTDQLTGDHTTHAEQNAILKTRYEPRIFEPHIMVCTIDSCLMCQAETLNRMGRGAIIASVFSREEAENLGHLNRRDATTEEHADGLRFVRLPHPRLQKKANVLYKEHVTRDPATEFTRVFDLPRLEARFSEIDQQYPLY